MAKRGKYYKVSKFSFEGFDTQHIRTTEAYARLVQTLFDRATSDVAANATKIKPGSGDKPFSFADYPSAMRHMESVTKQLTANVTTTIERGSRKEWLFACQKNDAFIERIFDTTKLSKATLKKLQNRNLDALNTFQQRKADGMELSQRVWKYVDQWREHIEMAIDAGLGDGTSAASLAHNIKQDLREPNRLFRRVRDKRGILHLSKAAKSYHPGQGVYRSSARNAQRLARTEINMAYRESDFRRWQQLDFIVGVKIARTDREPRVECPLCDRLAGIYPKTFRFVPWHPQCMCHVTPLLMDDETFDANELGELRAALRGTEYRAQQAKNVVTDVPSNFKSWAREAAAKQQNWAHTPYFVRYNFKNGKIADGLSIELPVVNAAGRVEYHIPFEQLPDKEKQAWETAKLDLYIDYDLEMACRLYGVSMANYERLNKEVYDGNQYWRKDELAAEIENLKRSVKVEIDKKKVQAEQIIADFKQASENARTWIVDNDSNVVDSVERRLSAEQREKYPDYIQFINGNTPNAVVRLNQKVDKAKQDYRDAVSQGNAAVAKYDKALTADLQHVLAERPTESYPAELLTADILSEINRIKNTSVGDAAIEKALSIKRGKPMTFDEADQHRANESYNKTESEAWAETQTYIQRRGDGHPYHINCQSCVVAHEMRIRGFDVEAQPNYNRNGCVPTELSRNTNLIWIDPATGKTPTRTWMKNKFTRKSAAAAASAVDWYNEQTKEVGRYSITYRWKIGLSTGGHIICAERLPNGHLRVYDPQSGKTTTLEKICASLNWTTWNGETCGVQRVDTMMVDTNMIAGVVRKRKK